MMKTWRMLAALCLVLGAMLLCVGSSSLSWDTAYADEEETILYTNHFQITVPATWKHNRDEEYNADNYYSPNDENGNWGYLHITEEDDRFTPDGDYEYVYNSVLSPMLKSIMETDGIHEMGDATKTEINGYRAMCIQMDILDTLYGYTYLIYADGYVLVISYTELDANSTQTEKIANKVANSVFLRELEPNIDVGKEFLLIRNGESSDVNLSVTNIKNPNESIIVVSENENVCQAFLISQNEYEYKLVLDGIGAGHSLISLYLQDYPDIVKTIEVYVSMSDEERNLSDSIEYLSDTSFFYYDSESNYVLLFGFRDKEQQRLVAPASVRIRIENDDNEVVYEKTRYVTSNDFSVWSNALYGDRRLASIRIDPNDILKGNSTNGDVYFTVVSGFCSFDEKKLHTSELPKLDIVELCDLSIPDLPCKISHKSASTVYTEVTINTMSFNYSERYDGMVDLTLVMEGKKEYDYRGDTKSSTCSIGWKLYDTDNYVIDSGVWSTNSLETGERFKNWEKTIYKLKPGSYRIKLIDVE